VSELVLSVDPAVETPPYRQIVDQLRGFIERGDLLPGDALPTVRQLAGDLGVAPNTVVRAYAELQDEGWLQSDGRRGTRVTDHGFANDKPARARVLRGVVGDFVNALLHRGYSEAEVSSALRQFDAGTLRPKRTTG
jgi:DNA-binding transcriptional regulator YhcF (GntR family)